MSPPKKLPERVTTPDPLSRVKSLIPSTGSELFTWLARVPSSFSSLEKYCFFISASSVAPEGPLFPLWSPPTFGIKCPTVLRSSRKYFSTTALTVSFVTPASLSS